jgi:uncharacterized protein (DUF736 family)
MNNFKTQINKWGDDVKSCFAWDFLPNGSSNARKTPTFRSMEGKVRIGAKHKSFTDLSGVDKYDLKTNILGSGWHDKY